MMEYDESDEKATQIGHYGIVVKRKKVSNELTITEHYDKDGDLLASVEEIRDGKFIPINTDLSIEDGNSSEIKPNGYQWGYRGSRSDYELSPVVDVYRNIKLAKKPRYGYISCVAIMTKEFILRGEIVFIIVSGILDINSEPDMFYFRERQYEHKNQKFTRRMRVLDYCADSDYTKYIEQVTQYGYWTSSF